MERAGIKAEVCDGSIAFSLTEVPDFRRIRTRTIRVSTNPSKRQRPKMPREIENGSTPYIHTEAFWVESLKSWICFNCFRRKPGFYEWDKGGTLTQVYYQGPYRISGQEWAFPTSEELDEAEIGKRLPHRRIKCYAPCRLLRLELPTKV